MLIKATKIELDTRDAIGIRHRASYITWMAQSPEFHTKGRW